MFSGFTAPILESVQDRIDFLPPSYIISLRDRLREMKAFLWIEKSWAPQLQRERDSSIMNTFAQCPKITRAMLRQANAVRIYMRVVTIEDLTDVGGTFIPSGMLTGDWTAGTDLQWPYQPKPPPAFWSVFRKCLRLTFCTNTPPYSRPHHSLALDTPLGKWYAVKRNTWFQVYKSDTDVFWRKEETGEIYQMRPSNISGFHHTSKRVSDLPLDCHPIRFKQMGDTIWTHGKYRGILNSCLTSPPGHIIENTLVTDDTELIMLGSDGSVHLYEGLAACAWIIYQSEQQQLKACYVLENMTSISSYRSELEGMYRGLLDVNIHLKPRGIRQWSDNEAAVKKYNTELYKPSQMIMADADIILAIKHARGKLVHTDSIICKHVYGHQDSAKCRDRELPQEKAATKASMYSDSSEYEDYPSEFVGEKDRGTNGRLPLEAQINIDCDRIASETIAAVRGPDSNRDMHQVISLPYEGSKALLNINNTWITAHQRRFIGMAKGGQTLKEYCCHRYSWDDHQFRSVLWDIIRAVRKNITHTQLTKTSKIMHGWLPIMHMQGHATGITQCPCCQHPDETMEHLFQCTNAELMKKKDALINDVRKNGMAKGIPRAIMEALCRMLYDFVHAKSPTIPEHLILAKAVQAQISLGIRLLPRGFISEQWIEALRDFGVEHPQRKIASLLKLIWFDFTDKLWQNRNDIAHGGENQAQRLEQASWAEKLLWYLENKHVLAQRDQYIISYEAEDVSTMPARIRRKLVHNLERLEAVYARELQMRKYGLRSIRDYFTPKRTQENTCMEMTSSERPSAAHSV